MSEDILDAIWSGYRTELQDDHVGLWMLITAVRRERPDYDPAQIQAAVLEMVERALRRGEARAGVGARNFGGLEHVWNGPVDQIIERIRKEWDQLGRDPLPGEIVWLDRPL